METTLRHQHYSHRTTVLDQELITQLKADPDTRERYVFLEPHQDFIGFWRVEGFDRGLYFHFRDEIGPYRVVAPSGLDSFLRVAEDGGYHVVFMEDPSNLLRGYEALNEAPDLALHSDFPGTTNGMLPYQIQGFNFLRNLRGGIAMWSTGTGKSILASALVKDQFERHLFDTAFVVVKSHNKVNFQRTIERLTKIESVIVKGAKKTREGIYASVLEAERPQVVVLNYEKFRDDHDALLPLFENRRILNVWDEMPSKLKTRTSQLYKAVCSCLYTTNPPQVRADKLRPAELRQFMLSATPIENDPEDWFNCVRLLDPSVYGTVKEFRSEYVSRWSFWDPNTPESWHKLDKMGLVGAHITHEVDKADPDIAKHFPEFHGTDDPLYIDWDEKDRKIYDRFAKELVKELDDEIPVVSAIGVMQMLCDCPTMVSNSGAIREAHESLCKALLEDGVPQDELPDPKGSIAAMKLVQDLDSKLTNERHTKLAMLRQLLTEDHPDEKVVVFSAFNDSLLPLLEDRLKAWGIGYIRYGGTAKARQEAEDLFRSDPDVQVFLSSDAGSDSINLEVASVIIHYDLPWKWSTVIQRQNRIHRVTSSFRTVRVYTLLMANSVEERRLKIIRQKASYHEGVFKGAIADRSASARMTAQDLRYILAG